MNSEPRTTPIHILDDDSLLHAFYLYRPYVFGEDENEISRSFGGSGRWIRGRWWYKLAQVCQRWRNVILGSAPSLDLFLVCTHGTPVADMLAHSPHLPLVIDYDDDGDSIPRVTAEDEEGAILALKMRDRVRCIRLCMLAPRLQKFIEAMYSDDEYPILEYLIIRALDNDTVFTFSETLQAPHLHSLLLRGFALPIGSRLLPTAVGLVTLYLIMFDPSIYFQPNTFLQWISLMPQLESFAILFSFSIPNRDVERQLMHTPITAHVTLPNLHYILFQGVNAYLEALVHWITTPRLEKLEILLFNQLMFLTPRLSQFVNTSENLRFESVKFKFCDSAVYVKAYPVEGIKEYTFAITVDCWHLDWQVSSAAQISNSLTQIFSAVEHLILVHEVHSESSDEHNEIDRTEWRKLLKPFSNVKTLRIDDGLVEDLSRCLQSEDGEPPLELLPELQELTYSGSGDTDDAFTSFMVTRSNAGRRIALARRSPIPTPYPSYSASITAENTDSEAGSDHFFSL